MQETKKIQVQCLHWEDPLEENMTTHSSILAWRISWTDEPGRLQSMGSQRIGHDSSDLAHMHANTHFPDFSEQIRKLIVQCVGIPWYPIVKTLHLQCRGLGLIPGWRTKIPHAAWPKKKRMQCVILGQSP